MRTTLKQCKEALIKADGIVSQAARNLGITRNALNQRIMKYPALKAACAEAREYLIDKGESALVTAVENNEAWAISLLLKTLGKNRGYVEKTEFGVDGNITVNVVKFSDKQE